MSLNLRVPICKIGALDQVTSTGPSESDSPEPLTCGRRHRHHQWQHATPLLDPDISGRREGRKRDLILSLLTATRGNKH